MKLGILPMSLIGLVVVTGIGYAVVKGGLFRGEETVEIQGAQVRLGDLRISETVRANLEASNAAILRCEIERGGTILFLEEEGKQVEVGDLVCELDVSEMVDRGVEQEITVNRARADLTKAEEQFAIQEIQNLTDLAKAQLELRFAEMDLEKYVGREKLGSDGAAGTVLSGWQHEIMGLDEAIMLREQELTQAKKELEFTRELVSRDFAAQNDLEQDELSYERARIAKGQAEREKALTLEYAHERRLEELRQAIETSDRDLQKTERQARAHLADYQADMDSARFTLAREEDKLTKIGEQIGKAKIYAPVSGIVVYARERSRWGSGDPIDEGTSVRERQDIISIPQAGGMIAEAKLHETSLKKVQVGQKCLVRVDAQPGELYEGRVDFVAQLPDSGSYWSNPNQRVYRSMIALDGGGEGLRPGMSCNIEILVEDLTNVLFVPRQCVFFDGRETVVFRREAGETTRRVVRVGQDNAQWVMIEEGLKEGDVVLLAPPSDFKPEGVSPGAPEDGPAAEKVEGSPAGGASGRSPGGSRGGYSGGAQAGSARGMGASSGGRGSSAGSEKSGGGRPSGGTGGRPSEAKSNAGTGGRPSGSSSGGARSGQAAGKGGK
ncbi:MAG: efflux RND transporter periplasmic adaptor subunit [Planctomycetota bacterium]|nr:efflux RND transporter periplasmic adaptor subunit [Planctomycetota bacterium]